MASPSSSDLNKATREETQTFFAVTSTSKLGRKIETLIEYLLRPPAA